MGRFLLFGKQTDGLVNKIEKKTRNDRFLVIITKLNRFTHFLKSTIELAKKTNTVVQSLKLTCSRFVFRFTIVQNS